VITVCSSAAGETCPAYLGPVLRTHWGVEDPAHATGTDEEIDAAFVTAYRILRARIEAFLAVPLDDLQQDKGSRQSLTASARCWPETERGASYRCKSNITS
jgi:arsenate reductase